MFRLLKPFRQAPQKLFSKRLRTTKQRIRRLKHDLAFAYYFVKNPVKFDFDCTFDEADLP